MARLLPLALAFAVLVYALIDCVRTPQDEMPAGLPKPLWLVLIVLLPLVGPVAWLVAWRVSAGNRRGPGRPGPARGAPGRRPPSRGPVAPDDDPEFLARLERERRRAERQRRDDERRGRDSGHGSTDPGQTD